MCANMQVGAGERRGGHSETSPALTTNTSAPEKKATQVKGPPKKETEILLLQSAPRKPIPVPFFPTRPTLRWGEGPHLLPELDDRRRGVLRGRVQGAVGPLELYTEFYPWVPGKEARERSLTIWHD